MALTPRQAWGVDRRIPAVLVAAAIAGSIWAAWTRSPADRLVSGFVAALALVTAFLTWAMRRRCQIDDSGLQIAGPFGARNVGWPEILAVDAPSRRRRGLASTSLEIELTDEGLIVLSRFELGKDPAAVADAIRREWIARPGARSARAVDEV